MKVHTEDCLDANDDTSVLKGKCICVPEKSEPTIKKFSVVLITYHKDGTESRNIVAENIGFRKANEISRINNMKNDNDCLYLVQYNGGK